jgi:phosphatidylglycerophosphatase A
MHTPRLPMLTVFGLGRLRPAPGTWGSLPPVALAAALFAMDLTPGSGWYELVLAGIGVVFAAACVVQGDLAEAVLGKKDHGSIVADETAGQCVPLLILPSAGMATPALAAFTLVLAFLAFRAADIVKPWPARQIQSLRAGWGVLADDLVAGLYAAAIVHLAAALAL